MAAQQEKESDVRYLKRATLLATMLAALEACGSSGTQSEAIPNPGESASSETMSHDMGPFFQVEMNMNDRMMAAEGTNSADSWLRKMIEHHRGAVELSNVLLQQLPSGPVAEMARTTVAEQTKEISELQSLLQNGPPDYQSAILYQPVMAKMHDAMMEAQGADVSETWIRKMLEHHSGAVGISDVLLRQHNVPAAIKHKAEVTRNNQQKEIQIFERMLRAVTGSH